MGVRVWLPADFRLLLRVELLPTLERAQKFLHSCFIYKASSNSYRYGHVAYSGVGTETG